MEQVLTKQEGTLKFRKLTKMRKNKGYTSILLNEMSEEAFISAGKTYNALEGARIIKPSKAAMEVFVKLHSLTLDKVKAGEKYKILGTTFKVIRSLDYSRKGSNAWYPIVRYFDNEKQQYEEFGIIQTSNFAVGVHETCFKNLTGKLLYF